MEKTASPISFARQLQVFLPFAMGYFLSYLYRVINAVLAPDLGVDSSSSGLGFLTATYFITFAAQWGIGAIIGMVHPIGRVCA